MWEILVFTKFPCWCCSAFLSFISLIFLFLFFNISKSLTSILEYLYPIKAEPQQMLPQYVSTTLASDSHSLDQHLILSRALPDFLLASH